MSMAHVGRREDESIAMEMDERKVAVDDSYVGGDNIDARMAAAGLEIPRGDAAVEERMDCVLQVVERRDEGMRMVKKRGGHSSYRQATEV